MLFPLNNPTDKVIEYKHGMVMVGEGGGYQKNIYMYLEKKRGGGIVNSVLICLLSRLIDLVIDWLNVKWKVLEMRSFYDLK